MTRVSCKSDIVFLPALKSEAHRSVYIQLFQEFVHIFQSVTIIKSVKDTIDKICVIGYLGAQ